MVEIRPYLASDRDGLLACIVELRDHEGTLEADRLPGTVIAETHLAYLQEQCRQKRGVILVAVSDTEVLGFVCVWADEDFGEHYAVPARAAHLSDLVVRAPHRRCGLGQELTRAAERFAGDHRAELLTVNVLVANRLARSFYAASGYREYELVLTKPLAGLSGSLAEPNVADVTIKMEATGAEPGVAADGRAVRPSEL
jgi:ribosomal protein S18 acetylase RimI-like enzyme